MLGQPARALHSPVTPAGRPACTLDGHRRPAWAGVIAGNGALSLNPGLQSLAVGDKLVVVASSRPDVEKAMSRPFTPAQAPASRPGEDVVSQWAAKERLGHLCTC